MIPEVMTFNEGRAVFISCYKEHVTWPIGPPSSLVVDNKVVIKPASYAQFENYRWGTRERQYAEGMLTMPHFGDREGWHLDTGCIPKIFVELWGAFSTSTKRKIGLALAEGKDPEEVFDSLTDVDLEGPRAKADARSETPAEHICPVPGCGLKADTADDIKAKVAIMDHVRMVHPDWEG